MKKVLRMKKVFSVLFIWLLILQPAMCSITIVQQYTNPSNGVIGSKNVVIDITGYRTDPSDSASQTYFITAYDASQSTTFSNINIDGVIRQVLDGRYSSPMPDVVQSYAAAAVSIGTCVAYVDNNTGFTIGQPIAISSTYEELTNNVAVSYCIISTISNTTTLNLWTVPAYAYSQGAIVQQLMPKGSSLVDSSQIGLKSKFESPAPPTNISVSTTTTGGAKLMVGWTISVSSTAYYYNIYASQTALNGIPSNLIPTYSDATWSSNTATITLGVQITVPVSTTGYYIYVLSKDGQGLHDNNWSRIAGSSASYQSSL